MRRSIALITGATSGLGHAAARMLAAEDCREVIVTGRSMARAQETAARLAAETGTTVFTPTVGFIRANLLSPNARIVIAGAEPARGSVPLFGTADLPAFAAGYHQGDRTAVVEALLRNGPNVKYVPNNAYADAKLIIARWAAALARRLPSGMAAYAVSPGAATDTKVARNAGLALRYLFIPIVNLIPGMNRTPESAARRYLQASEFGPDVSGQFFASARGKFTGAIEAQRHPHLHDRASQEAAWQAVVGVSGVDLSNPSPSSAVA